ncbi:hypothetical protein [Streptomyces sp. NPDC053079]|uniref:hypothetical protein n=1 Tax=Streptomyces sp. NPDC053079 TaxID=3365697 RepID=UPI0037D9865E
MQHEDEPSKDIEVPTAPPSAMRRMLELAKSADWRSRRTTIRSQISLAIAAVALVTSVVGLTMWGVPNRDDIQQVRRCVPVVAQSIDDGARAVAQQVVAGHYDQAEVQRLKELLTTAEANFEGVLDKASQCLEPATRARLSSTLKLIKSALQILATPLGLPGGSSPTPNPSPS